MDVAGRISTASAALASTLRRLLSLPPRPTEAEQQAEAARAADVAAEREARDEVMRATSRRVMNEMWPSRSTAARAAAPAGAARTTDSGNA